MHATLFAAEPPLVLQVGTLATVGDKGACSPDQSDYSNNMSHRFQPLLFRSRPKSRPRAGWHGAVVLKSSHILYSKNTFTGHGCSYEQTPIHCSMGACSAALGLQDILAA
jgi:hypothetical protein